MCDFVSWIEGPRGKIWFMTDRDCKKAVRENPRLRWDDVIGHSALKQAKPEAEGSKCEGVACIPVVIAKAIKAGKMREMMENTGYKVLTYDRAGKLHNLRGPAISKGSYGYEYYYIHGKWYTTKAAWTRAVNKLRKAKSTKAKGKAKGKAKK